MLRLYVVDEVANVGTDAVKRVLVISSNRIDALGSTRKESVSQFLNQKLVIESCVD